MSAGGRAAHQLAAVLRLELRKAFLGRRVLILLVLASLPVAICCIALLIPEAREELRNTAHAGFVFAGIYQALMLRFVIYFGCVWIFTNLFRGDILDGSLHYFLLCPIRREILAAGKFLAGLALALFLFYGSTLVSLSLLHLPGGLVEGLLAKNTFTYLGITLLACLGYGSVFLLTGMVFRSPIVPAIVFYGWEWLNFLLPPLLKKFSVIHYVNSLSPITFAEDNPFAVLAEPTPVWIAVPGLLAFSLVVLTLAAWQARRLQIDYGGE